MHAGGQVRGGEGEGRGRAHQGAVGRVRRARRVAAAVGFAGAEGCGTFVCMYTCVFVWGLSVCVHVLCALRELQRLLCRLCTCAPVLADSMGMSANGQVCARSHASGLL